MTPAFSLRTAPQFPVVEALGMLRSSNFDFAMRSAPTPQENFREKAQLLQSAQSSSSLRASSTVGDPGLKEHIPSWVLEIVSGNLVRQTLTNLLHRCLWHGFLPCGF